MAKAAPVPLISVALCTFNGERHLAEQLDSLLAQDWPNLEIVAVDDASLDTTPAILADYANRDSRIRFTRNAHNLGYEKNFETTMARCRGRWIAPCDQDDVWLPNKLSVLAGRLLESDATLSYCDSELMDEAGRSLHRRISDRIRRVSTDDPASFLFANCTTGHAMLFERELLGQAAPFPTGVFHDWWLGFVATSFGRIVYVDECLVRYRQHAATMTDITGTRKQAGDHSRGFRWRELAETGERLRRFAQVPGKGQAFVQELVSLWQARESQFVSPRMAAFVWRHRARLFAFQKDSEARRKRKAAEFFWGLRTKRLIEPRRYAHDT